MSLDVLFWAQSADNASADVMATSGSLLAPTSPARKALMERISVIARRGTQVHRDEHATVIVHGSTFLLELVPREVDVAGRRAPVVCVGDIPPGAGLAWAREVVAATTAFAARAELGRTVSEAAEGAAVSALLTGLEKKKRRTLGQILGLCFIVAVVSLAAAWGLSLAR